MIRFLVNVLVFVMNARDATHSILQLYVLENLTRVPHFTYPSALYLYETIDDELPLQPFSGK